MLHDVGKNTSSDVLFYFYIPLQTKNIYQRFSPLSVIALLLRRGAAEKTKKDELYMKSIKSLLLWRTLSAYSIFKTLYKRGLLLWSETDRHNKMFNTQFILLRHFLSVL